MTRMIRKSVDFFPHPVSWSAQLDLLQTRFGNTGYAFWYKLLEQIGGSDSLSLDFKNSRSWKTFLAYAAVSSTKANEILDEMARNNMIDGELWHADRVIWMQEFVEQMKPVFKKRKEAAPTKPLVINRPTDLSAADSQPNGTKTATKKALIVEESKVEERQSKEKQSKEERESPADSLKAKQRESENQRESPASPARAENEVQVDKAPVATVMSAPVAQGSLSQPSLAQVKTEADKGSLSQPSLAQVKEYAVSQGYKNIDPEAFHDYYSAKGWMLDSGPVRDWQALLRNWVRRERNTAPAQSAKQSAPKLTRETPCYRMGVGERLTPDLKFRTYGDGSVRVPLNAPPRPSESSRWYPTVNGHSWS